MPARPTLSFHPSVTGAVPLCWPDSLAVAAAAGFQAMDVVLPEVVDQPPEAVRAAFERAGVLPGPASLPVEFRLDEETFRRDVAELPRFARHAATVGVATMFRSIPASSDVPAAELLPVLRRRISTCASILGTHGIDFAIEVLGPLHRRREGPHEIVWRLADAAELARTCEGDVGLLVDAWHWHHAGETAQDILALGDDVRHVHIADAPDIPADEIRDEQRLLPGRGIIDLAGFFEALATLGYSRFVSPEVRGYACDRGPEACASAAREASDACIEARAR